MNQNIPPSSTRIHIPSGAEHVTRWVVVALALGLSLLVAFMIGEGKHTLLFLLGAVVFLVVGVMVLGRRAWVLIPLGWSLPAATGVLPISLSIRDSTIIVATCALITYRIISGISMRQKMHLLDRVLLVNLGYLMVTLVIHPVGFYSFGSEMIGARSVFNIGMAVVAYWILVRLPDSPRIASRVPLFVLAGALGITALHLASYVFPSLPRALPYLYAAVDITTFYQSPTLFGEVPRYQRLGDGGAAIVLVLCAYKSPRTLLNLFRPYPYLLLLGFVGILASGFRSILLWSTVCVCLSAWLHREWREMISVAIVGACLLLMVVLGHGRLYEIPLPAQRAMSFLPGKWSAAVTEEAESSIEVRFQWWRDIIKEDIIKNWWVGDGFGTRLEDVASVEAGKSGLVGMTTLGSFHSGPLTTIRYCGIFGLILFYVLTITCAVVAVRCVRQAQGTILLPLAVFLAIQFVWIPFHFTLVFGAYNVDMPQQIFLAGLLRLLIRMLDTYKPSAGRTPTGTAIPVRRMPVATAARQALRPK